MSMLDRLPEAERNALLRDYSKGMLDIGRKAQELGIEVGALSSTLGVMAGTVEKATMNGSAATATYTNTSSLGRVEVIVGNTESAKTGKLSRSQSGDRDWTPYYVFGGLLALVLVAALIGVK